MKQAFYVVMEYWGDGECESETALMVTTDRKKADDLVKERLAITPAISDFYVKIFFDGELK